MVPPRGGREPARRARVGSRRPRPPALVSVDARALGARARGSALARGCVKILHVHRVGGIGGSERHLLTLLPALAERDVDVSFLGLDDPSRAPDPFYERLSVPYERIPAPRDVDPMRSEERRVGKECRSRWWRVEEIEKCRNMRDDSITLFRRLAIQGV